MRRRFFSDGVRGIIALALALSVALTLFVGVVIAELRPDGITDLELNLLSLLAGGAIAEVATFIALGKATREDDKENEHEHDDT
jgi:hypothetical protein